MLREDGIIMYKKGYYMLFNRISDIINCTGKVFDKNKNADMKKLLIKILEYLIETQRLAEDVIIESDDII